MTQSHMYIAYTIGENDFNDPYLIGVFTDTVQCKIALRQFIERTKYELGIFKIEKVLINTTYDNFIEETFFYKMNVNDFMNPIQKNTFKEILNY